MFDPDGHSGSGLWHWVVYDIPAATTHIDASANGAELPGKAQTAQNDQGVQAYTGPCPPRSQSHHYRITVYALDVPYLQYSPSVGAAAIVNRFTSHVLAQGSLVGSYGR